MFSSVFYQSQWSDSLTPSTVCLEKYIIEVYLDFFCGVFPIGDVFFFLLCDDLVGPDFLSAVLRLYGVGLG